MNKKLIETEFPMEDVNTSSMREKITKGHPGNLHLWWGRTPIRSTSALLFAALADKPEEEEKKAEYDRVISGLAAGEESTYEKAREILASQDNPVICDSFCGYGGIPLAATELGLTANASDLNSVAVLLTKAAAEIPSRFSRQKPVHPGDQKEKQPGSAALAEDLLYYGSLLEQKAEEKLSPLYPRADGREVLAWIQVRTAECPNPACRCRMPLASSFILSKKKGNEAWAEPVLEGGRIVFRIRSGPCPPGKESNKLKNRGSAFRCPACGETSSEEYIRTQGKAGKLGTRLMAVVTRDQKEKAYSAADDAQERAAEIPAPEGSPEGSILENSHYFNPPLYGFTEYRVLYTPRQLRMLCTFCDLISEIQAEAAADAQQAGMKDDGIPLEEGGCGASAYGQAISVFLSLAVSRMANRNSSICTWDDRNGNVRSALRRQLIPMSWTFVEENPFSDGPGNFQSMLRTVAESAAALPTAGSVRVSQGDALEAEIPEGSLFCGELPYYDSTAYADLSDYFYIWLRRCLKDTYPTLFDKLETSKDELCSIPEHYGKESSLAIQAYRDGLRELCRKLSKKVSAEYPSLLFYRYTRADEEALLSEAEEETSYALEFLLDSLHQSGLQITGLWPVRTEDPGKKPDSTRIVVAFRKAEERLPGTTRRMWISIMKKRMPKRIEKLSASGVKQENISIAALGFGISSFAEYEKILNADGTEMTLHSALHFISREVEELLSNMALEDTTGEEEKHEGKL